MHSLVYTKNIMCLPTLVFFLYHIQLRRFALKKARSQCIIELNITHKKVVSTAYFILSFQFGTVSNNVESMNIRFGRRCSKERTWLVVVYHLPKKSRNFGWNVNGKTNFRFPNIFERQSKIPKWNFQTENVRSIRSFLPVLEPTPIVRL